MPGSRRRPARCRVVGRPLDRGVARVRLVQATRSASGCGAGTCTPFTGVFTPWATPTSPRKASWLAAVKACGEYADAEPLRRGVPSPLAANGTDARSTSPASAAAGIHASARTRPPSSSASSSASIPVTPRLRTITDLARTNPNPSSNAPSAKPSSPRPNSSACPQPASSAASSTSAPPRPPAATKTSSWTSSSKPASPIPSSTRLPRLELHPDLWWPDARLIVEVDSREHHEAPLDQRDDLNRQAWLEARGERVLRTTKPQVLRDPEQFFQRLRAAGAPVVWRGRRAGRPSEPATRGSRPPPRRAPPRARESTA